MFRKRKKNNDFIQLTDEVVYDIYTKQEFDIYDTINYLIEFHGLSVDDSSRMVEDAVFSKVKLRSIYCLECNWDMEKAIVETMKISGYGYDICKSRLNKMINDCELGSAKYRIEKSYVNNDVQSFEPKENESFFVKCPKCNCQSITTTNKKLSVKRGVVGAVVGLAVPGVGSAAGAVVGGLSSKKLYNVCMNCGHRWKL